MRMLSALAVTILAPFMSGILFGILNDRNPLTLGIFAVGVALERTPETLFLAWASLLALAVILRRPGMRWSCILVMPVACVVCVAGTSGLLHITDVDIRFEWAGISSLTVPGVFLASGLVAGIMYAWLVAKLGHVSDVADPENKTTAW